MGPPVGDSHPVPILSHPIPSPPRRPRPPRPLLPLHCARLLDAPLPAPGDDAAHPRTTLLAQDPYLKPCACPFSTCHSHSDRSAGVWLAVHIIGNIRNRCPCTHPPNGRQHANRTASIAHTCFCRPCLLARQNENRVSTDCCPLTVHRRRPALVSGRVRPAAVSHRALC